MSFTDQVKQIEAIRELNFFILGKYSRYLNGYENFINREMVGQIVTECGVDQAYAFQLLFIAACGLFPDDNERDKELTEGYLIPSLHMLDHESCLADAYYNTIKLPQVRAGNWEFKTETWQAYQAFVLDDVRVDAQLHEVPQLGYFNQTFSFPAVLENGREWMSVTPSEIATIRPAIEKAHGRVMTFGLGLGYYPFMVSEKPDVEHMLIVEKDEQVIKLFTDHILPQFPHREKIEIIHEDAFVYAEKILPRGAYDLAYADTWHDAADGVEHYLRMNKLEKLSPGTHFMYWVEDTLLSYLRWYFFDQIKNVPQQYAGQDLFILLSNENVKKMALDLPYQNYADWLSLD